MSTAVQDLQHSFRLLRKRPTFTAVVLLVLGLGIGANTALFSVVDAWLLRPLPFPAPDELTAVWKTERERPNQPAVFPAWRDFDEWRRRNTAFQAIAGVIWRPYVLLGGNEPVELAGEHVTPEFFRVLGIQPLVGRTFDQHDERNPDVVVLSERIWRARFAGDGRVIGRAITLNGKPYEVVGVMPRGFRLPSLAPHKEVDLWTLLAVNGEHARNPVAPIAVIGRLKNGRSIANAGDDLASIQHDLDQRFPAGVRGIKVMVSGLQEDISRSLKEALLVLSGAVMLVLLVACANVANLLLGRATERRKELAIRTALGASRRRLLWLMLSDTLALAALGAVTGIVFAWLSLRYFMSLNPFETIAAHDIGLDFRALLFTIFISALTGVMFGLIPALDASRWNVNELLKESSRGATGGRETRRARNVLVVVEIGLSVVLLAGAALLLDSFRRLGNTSRGFDPDPVLVIAVTPQASSYTSSEERNRFYDRLLDGLYKMPGVRSAAASTSVPVGRRGSSVFSIEGVPPAAPQDAPLANKLIITPAYFSTMGIRLVRGRMFDERDRDGALPAVIINETIVNRYFPNQDPIGRRLKNGFPQSQHPWLTIVGVVEDTKDTKYNSVEWEVRPELFFPHWQSKGPNFDALAKTLVLTVRSTGNPPALGPAVRSVLREIDASLPVSDMTALRKIVDDSLSQPRLRAALLGVFALMALLLACVGLYGVMAQATVQRRQEFGVRMALGAGPTEVLDMVVRDGLKLAFSGVALGIFGALALTRVLKSFLVGVTASDPTTLILVSLLMFGVAFAASLIPAWRATMVDPSRVLRLE